jgi:hypothetical protein
MPSPLHLHRTPAPAVLLAAALVLGQPPLQPLGAFLAANATEFRWNLPLLALVALARFAPTAPTPGIRPAAAAAALAPTLWVGSGAAEHVAAATAAGGGLWGAPVHLLLAGILPVTLCLGVSRALGLGAVGLGALGLLWNFAQTGAREGWAWDWIESGPCWVLASLVAATHLWARAGAALSAAYLAFLSLSRTALITSAHHLQSPSNPSGLDPRQEAEALLTGVGGCPGTAATGAAMLALAALGIRGLRLGGGPRGGSPLAPAPLGAFAPAPGAGVAGLALSSVMAQTARLRALHWGFVLLFAAGLRLAWYGVEGVLLVAQPLALAPASSGELRAPAPLALLGVAGWLHLATARRSGIRRRLPFDAVCFPLPRFRETVGTWPGHVWYRPQCHESILSQRPLQSPPHRPLRQIRLDHSRALL